VAIIAPLQRNHNLATYSDKRYSTHPEPVGTDAAVSYALAPCMGEPACKRSGRARDTFEDKFTTAASTTSRLYAASSGEVACAGTHRASHAETSQRCLHPHTLCAASRAGRGSTAVCLRQRQWRHTGCRSPKGITRGNAFAAGRDSWRHAVDASEARAGSSEHAGCSHWLVLPGCITGSWPATQETTSKCSSGIPKPDPENDAARRVIKCRAG
jgi:hypothetical protein